MSAYTLIAPAKINLSLEVLGDRPDGFHELVMILQSIDLADRITLQPSKGPQHRIFCHHPQIPTDQKNLAYRAADLMARTYPDALEKYGGVNITIDKQIPIAAGLAGGSSDGAAVLVGLNMMWELGLTQPELQTLAAQLGSDIPFCVGGGTAIATGRGEQLDPLPDLDTLWVILAKYDSLAISTAWAYQTYRQRFRETYLSDAKSIQAHMERVNAGPLVQAISHKAGRDIGQHLHNDLEKVVLPQYPIVAQLRSTLVEMEELGTMMSGSGPTIFSLFTSPHQAEAVAQQLKQRLPDPDLNVWVAQLASNGIELA